MNPRADRKFNREFRKWYRKSGLRRPFLVPHKIEWDDIVRSLYRHRNLASGRMLDIGSRNRRYQELFQERVSGFWALDLFEKEIHQTGGVDVYGDAAALPIKDGSIDVALMTQVLGGIFDYEAALHEGSRVLRPGGVLILTHSQKCGIYHARDDYFRFTRNFYPRALAAAGFETEIIEPRSGTLALVGETLSTFVYYRWQRARIPRVIRFIACYPIQILFRVLDNMWFDENDTLGHVVVARRPWP
jgi:SAM-dependent methyltransferase